MTTAIGFPCSECGGRTAEIEGYIVGPPPERHFKGMYLWCIKCEHRWEQAA